MIVDTKGLTRAAVLAALFNAVDISAGYDPMRCSRVIDEYEAEEVIGKASSYLFQMCGGKRLEVDLSDENGFKSTKYDVGRGEGFAQKVIDMLRRNANPCHPEIISQQKR